MQNAGPVSAYLARLSPRSRRTYLGDAVSLAGHLFGPRQDGSGIPFFRTQSQLDGLEWHALGVDEGVRLCGALAGRYAPSTARRMLACYRGILRECWRQGRMSAEALARAIDLPAAKGSTLGRGRALTWPEVERLLAAPTGLNGRRDRAILATMIGGGLRRAEAAALRRDQIHWRQGRLELLVNGKGRRQRRIALPQWAAVRLKEQHRYVANPAPVFGLGDAAIADVVRQAAARAGLGVVSAHDLRRTYASLALNAGMPLASLSRAMGHAKVTTTMIYDRRPDEDVLAEAGRLDTGLGTE